MRAALTAWLSMAALAGGQGAVDLSAVLAPPVDAEFTETAGPTFLTGEFDAHRYAVWLAAGGTDVQSVESGLRFEGFVRGYSRTWSEPVHVEVGVGESRVQYLTETVEEFASGDGAQQRQDGTRNFVTGASSFEKAIDTTVPGAWGAVVDAGYSTNYELSFSKGNDVYFLLMDSAVNDMTDKLRAQAQSQYEKAPPYTIPPDGWQSPPVVDAGATTVAPDPNAWTRNPLVYLAELVSLIVVGGVLVLINRRRAA